MAQIYSTLFGHGSEAGPYGPASIYVVPTGFIAVVRDVCLWCYSGSGIALVNRHSGLPIAWGNASGAEQFFHSDLRAVFNPGDEIDIQLLGGDWTWVVSGYLLSAP